MNWVFKFVFSLLWVLCFLAEALAIESPAENPTEELAENLVEHRTEELAANQTALSPQLKSPYSQIKKGQAFLVGVKIPIPEGWHSYWSFAGDFGQSPSFRFRPIEGLRIKALPFPTPKRKTYPFMESKAYSFIYEKEVLIPFEFFVEEDYPRETLAIALDLEWAICKELCISKESTLTLNLSVSDHFIPQPESQALFDSWRAKFPLVEASLKSHFKDQDQSRRISFFFQAEGISCRDVFPLSKGDFLATPPVLQSQGQASCTFQAKKQAKKQVADNAAPKISGLLIYSKGGKQHSAVFRSNRKHQLGILWFALMAFLGGLLLNIMPCVLPVIFLKFYNSMELRELKPLKAFSLNLVYALGIIVSFLALAFFIFLSKQAGESLGWGFHLQSPLFVTFLCFVFALMAFYLIGGISFALPKAPLSFKGEKYLSHFMTGVLSTTAASPCTVPFMASSASFAFSAGYREIFVIFFFLGLGLSFPYIVLSCFPKALKYLPSPGRGLERAKKLFSIPLFLTALWLFYILYLQTNLKVFLLGILTFPLLLLWVLVQKLLPLGLLRRSLVAGVMILVLGLLSAQGFITNSLNAQNNAQSRGRGVNFKTRPPTSQLNWNAFSEEDILLDRQRGEKVFLAFGAEWCLTCKLNERIFKTPEFKALVETEDIRLYYGDWTGRDVSISRFFEKHAQAGVPFYVFFDGQERNQERSFFFPTLLFKESFLKKLQSLLSSPTEDDSP